MTENKFNIILSQIMMITTVFFLLYLVFTQLGGGRVIIIPFIPSIITGSGYNIIYIISSSIFIFFAMILDYSAIMLILYALIRYGVGGAVEVHLGKKHVFSRMLFFCGLGIGMFLAMYIVFYGGVLFVPSIIITPEQFYISLFIYALLGYLLFFSLSALCSLGLLAIALKIKR